MTDRTSTQTKKQSASRMYVSFSDLDILMQLLTEKRANYSPNNHTYERLTKLIDKVRLTQLRIEKVSNNNTTYKL